MGEANQVYAQLARMVAAMEQQASVSPWTQQPSCPVQPASAASAEQAQLQVKPASETIGTAISIIDEWSASECSLANTNGN